MRLPQKSDNATDIDMEQFKQMVDLFLKRGFTYFDTSYVYHDGVSETAIREALVKRHPRESFLLVSKFPTFQTPAEDKAEAVFQEQLDNCGVEYFDFYLFHNVCEMNVDAYLDEKYGIYDYLMKQKANGRIRHLGFSAHGSYDVMERFLQKYGSSMEFCQIQLNYLDWSFQDAKAKVELLKKYNIPFG